MWSRAILNQFNLPNEDLLCVAARARVREQVRASVSRDEIRDVHERGALDATARPVHTRGTRGLWVVQRVDDLENLILELSHGVIGSIPRHSVFVKVNFNDFRVGHVERIRFPTQRFDDILVILVREPVLLVQIIDEGEHAVPINVRAHHVRGFRRHAMARASRTVTAWVPSRRPVASCMEKWREKKETMSTHLDATARRR